jgi:hypothetical protein
MFQVLKSPRDTEESRIKDLASHIHRSQFRFSNSVARSCRERLYSFCLQFRRQP